MELNYFEIGRLISNRYDAIHKLQIRIRRDTKFLTSERFSRKVDEMMDELKQFDVLISTLMSTGELTSIKIFNSLEGFYGELERENDCRQVYYNQNSYKLFKLNRSSNVFWIAYMESVPSPY